MFFLSYQDYPPMDNLVGGCIPSTFNFIVYLTLVQEPRKSVVKCSFLSVFISSEFFGSSGNSESC